MSLTLQLDKPIAVIGAGLGGLAVAIGLLRHGFPVRIYEQADAFGEVGAGISISPNASKILSNWGLGEKLASLSCIPLTGTVRNGMTGEILNTIPLGDALREQFGAPYYQVLRPDLHQMMVDEAQRLDPEVFCLSHRLVDISGEDNSPVLEFANGNEVTASLVIGADGARSVVRAARFVNQPARFTRHIAFRIVLPVATLPARYSEPRSVVWVGDRRQLTHYPVAHFKTLNLVAFVSDQNWDVESWNARAEHEELQSAFAKFCPQATEVLRHLDGHELYKWALYDREPVDEWTRGRLVLMGDAAHPMLPYLGQGAAMAFEDAYVLSEVLKNHPDLPAALTDYQQRRVDRARKVLLASRATGELQHGADPDASRFSGDRAMRTQELFAPSPASLLG